MPLKNIVYCKNIKRSKKPVCLVVKKEGTVKIGIHHRTTGADSRILGYTGNSRGYIYGIYIDIVMQIAVRNSCKKVICYLTGV